MTSKGNKKVMGVEFAPLKIPFARRMQTLAVMHYLFMFLVSPVIALWLPVYMFFYTQYWYLVCLQLSLQWRSTMGFAMWLLWTEPKVHDDPKLAAFEIGLQALYMLWFYWDFDTPKRGNRVSEWMKDWKLMIYLRDYFPISLVKTVELDPNRNYVFGYHPHGLTSVGAFINFATNATDFQKVFPGIKSHLLTLVGQFWYPIRREYIQFFDVHESSKESMSFLLSQKTKGHAVVIVVGGAAEAVDAVPGSFNLTLKKRKGFVKQAIKHGADLVPVFSFGENDLFFQVESSPESRFRRFQLWLKQYTGIPPLMFHGRGVFNYTFGMMPYRRPIHTVASHAYLCFWYFTQNQPIYFAVGVFGCPRWPSCIRTDGPCAPQVCEYAGRNRQQPKLTAQHTHHITVGAPIRVTQCDNPTMEMVESTHQQYMDGLNALFETHKQKYGVPEDAHLNMGTL